MPGDGSQSGADGDRDCRVIASASQTARLPLVASSARTVTAVAGDETRNTLAAPTLPEPTLRRSMPRRRVSR